MSEEKIIGFDSKKDENPVEEVSKKYGLNLSDVEEVILPNGKIYFKFYDIDDRTLRMIENRSNSKNLSEQFRETQERLGFSQGENDKQNARAIFDYIVKYNNIELSLVPIADLKNNKSEYQDDYKGLEGSQKKELRTLLESAEQFELTHINFANMIGISKDNEVFKSVYNPQTGTCELVAAELRNYQTNKITGNYEGFVIEISDTEFDQIVADYDVENLEGESHYNSTANNSIIVKNRVVDFSSIISLYIAGTNINDIQNMNPMDKFIYKGIIAAIIRKKQKNATMQKQYVLTKKEEKGQAAFIDSILLSLLLGFFSGLLISVIFLAIKMYI